MHTSEYMSFAITFARTSNFLFFSIYMMICFVRQFNILFIRLFIVILKCSLNGMLTVSIVLFLAFFLLNIHLFIQIIAHVCSARAAASRIVIHYRLYIFSTLLAFVKVYFFVISVQIFGLLSVGLTPES